MLAQRGGALALVLVALAGLRRLGAEALLLAAGFSAGVLVSVAAVLFSLRASGVQVGFASFIGLSLLPTSPPRRAHRVSTADLDW